MYLSSRGVKILFILRWIACENCVLIYTNLTFSLSVSLPDSTRKQKRRIPLFNYLTAITMKRRKTAKETQMYRTVFWTLWERTRLDDLGESHWNMYKSSKLISGLLWNHAINVYKKMPFADILSIIENKDT